LRALLTEKASKNNPLLLEIAGTLNEALEFYAVPGPADDPMPAELSEGMVAHMQGFPVGLNRSHPRQDLVTMKAFVDRTLYLLRERKYTGRSIIDLFATKAGGAHFARKINREEAELLSSSFVGAPILNSSLLQLAEVTLALGHRLLRRICKFDLHLVIFAPQQRVDKPRVLLDSKYPDSHARFALALHPFMRLGFHAVGLEGYRASVITERAIKWPGTHYIWISTDLSDRLHTTLRITVDGEESSSVTLMFPLFVPNSLADFDTYWNRSQDDPAAGATFGFASFAAYGGEQSAIDRANLLLYFENRRKDAGKFYYYKPEAFTHSPPGRTDGTNTGVVMRTMESLRQEHCLTDEQ